MFVRRGPVECVSSLQSTWFVSCTWRRMVDHICQLATTTSLCENCQGATTYLNSSTATITTLPSPHRPFISLEEPLRRVTMPRPRQIDLAPFHPQISSLIATGCTYEFIRTTLEAATGTPISRRTFTRRLRELGITTKPIVEDSPALRARITHIFSTQSLTDAETIDALESEGFKLSVRTLSRMRIDMGLRKNNRGGVEKTVRVGVAS